MASTITVTPPPTVRAEIESRPTEHEVYRHMDHATEGRGGNRTTPQASAQQGGRGRGRGQRGNRGVGRANQRTRNQFQGNNQQSPLKPPAPNLGGGGISGDRSTRDAESSESDVVTGKQQDDGKEENEAETEAKFVIFTDNPTKRFEEFVDGDFQENDGVLGIKYEQKEIHNDTILLLRYNCPAADCDIACWGWPDLHRHVKNVHHKQLCDLCTRNKKVFTHEHDLFSLQELRKHEKFGDDNPGAVDQSGFKGHPQCGFCMQRFYGEDELYAHCRDRHERCHICDRRNEGRQQQYYQDYNALEEHFRRDHFLCSDQECMEKKFVVFDSEMDLKAHQLEAHPNGLTKDARRDARRVDISGFDYRAPHPSAAGGRGDRGGRVGQGRGRDPNTESLPVSTAQPMRRDEIAYQRQIAIQSAQSVTPRTFGGQLTSAERPRPMNQDRSALLTSTQRPRTDSSMPVIENITLTSNPQPSSQASHSLTPQESARHLQHASVVDRASSMLRNDGNKIAEFRTRVSSYRTSSITAQQLIDTFLTIFDVSSTDLGKLIKELADIYENDSKRTGLLKAWNDWRAINEDYPSLPGPSGILPGSSAASAGSGGRRVLKLKSSTAQSSRSAVSKQGSWGNNVAVNTNPFPRPGPSASGAKRSAAGGQPPAWFAGSSATKTSAMSAPSSRPVSRPPTSASSAGDGDAFPALPQAAKPNTLMMGLTRGAVRWEDPRQVRPTAPAWGGGGRSNESQANADGPDMEENEEESSKGKGRKGKKQIMFKFG